MSDLTTTLLEGFKNRRTIHKVTNEPIVSDERIEEILSQVVLHTPSAFNTQTARVVLLLKEDHEKLWDIAHESAKAAFPAEVFDKMYAPRIAMFRAAYGTALFYEDPAPHEPVKAKFPGMLDKHLPAWALQSSGMTQYAAWTLLEAEGLGCSLQHYSPLIDEAVAEEWNIPKDWTLNAQLVFGKPAQEPIEKQFAPLSERLFVHGK